MTLRALHPARWLAAVRQIRSPTRLPPRPAMALPSQAELDQFLFQRHRR